MVGCAKGAMRVYSARQIEGGHVKLILQARDGGHVHEAPHEGPFPDVVTFGPATFIAHCLVREGHVYRECSCVNLPSPLAAMRAARSPT